MIIIQLKGVYVEQLWSSAGENFQPSSWPQPERAGGSGSKKALWAYILCVLMEKMRKRPSAEAGFIERCLLSAAFSVST